MHLLITGSRGITASAVEHILNRFHAAWPITELTHGGARGVDKAAGVWAHKIDYDMSVNVHRPLWDRHGKRAGLIRNEEMLATCPALDCAYLAIWDGKSTGTAHMVNLMRESSGLCDDVMWFNTMPWHNWKGLRVAYRIPNKYAQTA